MLSLTRYQTKKNFNWSKLKALADIKINMSSKFKIYFRKRRNHCGKRRKCWLPAFPPFPHNVFFFRVVQTGECLVNICKKCGKSRLIVSCLKLFSTLCKLYLSSQCIYPYTPRFSFSPVLQTIFFLSYWLNSTVKTVTSSEIGMNPVAMAIINHGKIRKYSNDYIILN